MKTIIFTFITLFLIFTGCSSKQYFKPQDVVGSWRDVKDASDVLEATSSAALTKDRRVHVGSHISDVVLDSDESLIGYSDNWVIASAIDGTISLYNLTTKEVFKENLKRTIATASIKDDTLAVLFANNEMALYSISKKELLLKEQGDNPIAVSSKITPPFFKDDLVIFPTLDGKIVVVDIKAKRKLRSVVVGAEKYFNNIIFFELLNDKILAATNNKLLSMSQKEQRVSLDIRDVISSSDGVYVATKQGEVILLDSDLNQLHKIKFPFAHILGIATVNDKVFALEKSGYLLEMPKDLSHSKVYRVNIEKEDTLFAYDKKFYVGGEVILLN